MATWGRHTTIGCVQMSHESTRHSLKPTRKFLWLHSSSGAWVCEYVWGTAWASECAAIVCLSVWVSEYFCKNLHTDLIWSGRSRALLRSEMIGKALASLRGDVQPATFQPSGPPRSLLWSEVMNWSDILVLAEFWVHLKLHNGQWVKRRFWSNRSRRAGALDGYLERPDETRTSHCFTKNKMSS